VLDVAVEKLSLANRIRDVTLTFPRSTHTAIVGPPASGASTLLQIIAGELRPDSGEIRIGARNVTRLPARRRPALLAGSRIDAPGRWSVGHLLIAAVRQRTLDRQDRHHEYELAVEKWKLGDVIERPLRSLSSSEATMAQLARIELMRPGILLVDRVLENLNPSAVSRVADDFYRTLRVMGATVISAPASFAEVGVMDRMVVLDRGRIVQEGAPSAVYRRPVSEAAAAATGEVNIIPITVRGDVVESLIGSWSATASFQGAGIALARPEDFSVAAAGEESDLIFGIEEASFREGRWTATGILTGGFNLRVTLPGDFAVHKGRLIPLRFDSSRFVLLKRELR